MEGEALRRNGTPDQAADWSGGGEALRRVLRQGRATVEGRAVRGGWEA